ncbi:MAG: hypothetical protein ACFFAN_19875 [Promethearchaeota archaeon]
MKTKTIQLIKNIFQPIIYDTTLREGMQTPGGIGGSMEEKIFAANHIAVFADWVEIGMPANIIDYELIRSIKQSYQVNNVKTGIAVLCLNRKEDIDKAQEVIGDYKKTLAHIFIGTSEEHRKNRFGGKKSKQEYCNDIKKVLKYAAQKSFTRIMFSPEDSFRTFKESKEDFFDFVNGAISGYEEGKNKFKRDEKLVLNFPDTVGKSTILEFEQMLDEIIKRYNDKIEISVHCHNDSSASNQQAIEVFINKKANWLQTTFGGLGERNGIASTEGIIVNLAERGYLKDKPYCNKKDFSTLVLRTHAILAALGRRVPDEAIVSGSRVNISTAGIHTDLVVKDFATYHINGNKYGAKPMIEFGSTSGANQLIPVLKKIGINKIKKELIPFAEQLKKKCNSAKAAMSETDIMYEAIHYFYEFEDPFIVSDYCIRNQKNRRLIVLLKGIYYGKSFKEINYGSRTLETLINTIKRITGYIELIDFKPQVIPRIPEKYLTWKQGETPAIPDGLDICSYLKVTTQITDGNDIYTGEGTTDDVFKSIIDSTINAMIKMETIKKFKTKYLNI